MLKQKKTVLCYECKKAFKTEDACKSHGAAKKHQWQTPITSSVGAGSAAAVVAKVKVGQVPCPQCTKTFATEEGLFCHTQVKHQGIHAMAGINCSRCGCGCQSWSAWAKHYVSAHCTTTSEEERFVPRFACTSCRQIITQVEHDCVPKPLVPFVGCLPMNGETTVQSTAAPEAGIQGTMTGVAALSQVDATSANVDRPQILKLDNDDVLNTTDVCEDEHEEAQLNDSETALDDLSYSLPLCDRPQQESAPVSPGELCATPPSVSPPAVAEERTTENQGNQGPSLTNHTNTVIIALPSAAGQVLDGLIAPSEYEAADQAPSPSEVVRVETYDHLPRIDCSSCQHVNVKHHTCITEPMPVIPFSSFVAGCVEEEFKQDSEAPILTSSTRETEDSQKQPGTTATDAEQTAESPPSTHMTSETTAQPMWVSMSVQQTDIASDANVSSPSRDHEVGDARETDISSHIPAYEDSSAYGINTISQELGTGSPSSLPPSGPGDVGPAPLDAAPCTSIMVLSTTASAVLSNAEKAVRKAAKKARRAAAKAQNIEGMGEGMGEKKARKAAKRAAKKEQAAREAAERAERDATEKQAAERATQETANEVTVKQEVTRCARDVVGMDALTEETIGKGSGATPHEAGQNGVIGLDELAQLKQEIQNLKEAHQTLLSQADRIIMKITYMEDRLHKSLQTEDENGITSGIGVELADEAASVHSGTAGALADSTSADSSGTDSAVAGPLEQVIDSTKPISDGQISDNLYGHHIAGPSQGLHHIHNALSAVSTQAKMTSASECATRAGSQAMSIVEDLAEESDLSEWEEALFAESDEDSDGHDMKEGVCLGALSQVSPIKTSEKSAPQKT